MTPTLADALHSFPRLPLLEGPTPIQRLERVERALGAAGHGVRIFAKRDDHMALGGGGNKLRKLEFHLGAALADKADTLLTVGGIQSNHARLSAAAAARNGLACELFLANVVPRVDDEYLRNGNVVLDGLFGARLHVLPDDASPLDAATKRAEELRAEGRKAHVIPSGGSTAIGSLGYARCALEIAAQEAELGETFRQVVVANGSSGTHAGLAAGFAMLGRGAALVRSHSVLYAYEPTLETTLRLTREALALLGHSELPQSGDMDIDPEQRGVGYGVPTDEMIAAVRLLAHQEGLLVDPVYSGKAFAGLLADIRGGRYSAGDSVLFVMTGGVPGLFAYRSVFES
jgi:D-cysteine desulfhydrase